MVKFKSRKGLAMKFQVNCTAAVTLGFDVEVDADDFDSAADEAYAQLANIVYDQLDLGDSYLIDCVPGDADVVQYVDDEPIDHHTVLSFSISY